jgi:hypothetical protein
MDFKCKPTCKYIFTIYSFEQKQRENKGEKSVVIKCFTSNMYYIRII